MMYRVSTVRLCSALTVAGASATVWTNSADIRDAIFFGIVVKFTSSGSPNVQIDMEQGNAVPTTEGATDASWIIPDGVSAIATVTDTNLHEFALSPKVMRYLRIKLSAQSGNPTATTVAIDLNIQTPMGRGR